MNEYYVYTCSCPDTGVVKYVGMGKGRRIENMHKRNREARAWIEGLEACGKRPAVAFVAVDLTQDEAYAEEITTIARYGRACDGGQLFNVAIGGPGSRGWKHSDETLCKLRAKLTGLKKSPEHRAKIAENNRRLGIEKRGKPQSPEHRAKIAAAMTGKKISQETRDKLSAIRRGRPSRNRGVPLSAETRAKISETKRRNRLAFLTGEEAEKAKQ